MENKLINIRSLAYRLRLPISWLNTEAETGRIPALKVGKEFRFDEQAVREVLSARAQQKHKGGAGDGQK